MTEEQQKQLQAICDRADAVIKVAPYREVAELALLVKMLAEMMKAVKQ